MKGFLQNLSDNELKKIFGVGRCECNDGLVWNTCSDDLTCDALCASHGGMKSWGSINRSCIGSSKIID